MALGQDPGFKRKTWSKRGQGNKVLVLGNDTAPLFEFLADHIAEDAALFVLVVLLGSLQLFDRLFGDDREGNQLRVRMFERSSGRFAVIFEDQDVLEAFV